jgi:hypothetical protein
MIPYNSNKSGGCNNVSSNCVVWQGPDLPCIDLCHGDTISDVIAKLCEELVELSKLPGGSGSGGHTMQMSRINQTGLENQSGQAAQPATNETELTNLIIANVVQARQANQSEFGSGDVLTTPITLPTSMQYTDPNTSSIVRALPLQQYAELVGTRITNTVAEVTTLQGQVGSHEGRIVQLENSDRKRKTNPTEKQIITTCVGDKGRLTNVSTALSQVEKAFCGLQTGTGAQADLASSIGYQGASMASAKRLNGAGDLGTYVGFVTSPQNLAQSFTNAWIVLNDVRAAVESLIDDVVPTACADIVYGFFGNVVGTPGAATGINMNFTESSIPSTFYDCDRSQGSKITVTDDAGSTQTFHKQIHQLQTTQNGTTLTLSSLDAASTNYTVTTAFCFTNGVGTECANTITKTLTATNICPTLTLGTPGLTSISWTVDAGYLPNNYTAAIVLTNSQGSTIASQMGNPPIGSGWTGSFTGLTEGQQYQLQIYYGPWNPAAMSLQGMTPCPAHTFTTQGTTCADNKILAAAFKSTPADLQYSTAGSFVAMACDDVRNPGASMGDIYIAGFTTADGEVAGVLKNNTIWAETLTPCASSKINSIGVSIDYNNPVKSLVTNGVTTARTDATTNTLGDGWRYMDGITSTNGKNYFVYSEVNTDASAAPIIPQTYFSCVGDEINISQAAWTTWVPRSDAQYAFAANYNYHIAHGSSASSSSYSYSVGAGSFGTNSFVPNVVPSETQQFTYAPLTTGSFHNTDSNTTNLTIGSKSSGDYMSSFSRGFWLQDLTTDIVVFIDTDQYTTAEGAAIKTAMTAVHTEITTRYAGYTGNLYILPLKSDGGFDGTKQKAGSNAAYLSHHKIIALRGDGVTLNTTGDWGTIKQTYESGTSPVGWWGNDAASLSTNMMLFSFIHQSDKSQVGDTVTDLYTTTTAGAAPGAPTTRFKDDYDDVMNILVDNNRNTTGDAGTFKGPSTWAALGTVTLNTAYSTLDNAIYRCDGHYVIPKQTGLHAGTDGDDKALIRQMILACNATANGTTAALTANQYNAYRFGSDYLNVEAIANWKTNLITTANPYNATVTTTNSNALAPLLNLNITVVPYMDGYFEIPITGANLNEPFKNELIKLTCLDSVVNASASPTAGTASQMGGAGVQYGESPIAGSNTSGGACNEVAKGGAALQTLFNSTGVQFDGTVRCYKTSAGAIARDFKTELIHDRWYALEDGSAGKAVSQYSRTYPHWKNQTVCS